MFLSRTVSQQIVDQLSRVVEQNINVMDVNGIIISSTDAPRAGTVHSGAVRILRKHLQDLLVESGEEYPGARNGINLPIRFNNETSGAGTMTVSHANDSNFWVVTNLSHMTPDQGYKTQTLGPLVEGIGSIIGILLLSLFLI